MIKTVFLLILLMIESCLLGCSPVKPDISNHYKLTEYDTIKAKKSAGRFSILITHPDATSGYKTEEMLYIIKPFTIDNFAHNAWISPPGDMLLPLMVQSLQKSGFFYAVASTASSELTDYRVDTQLLELQQNFLRKPSYLDFSAKVVLTQVTNNQVIASRIIEAHVQCPNDSPYGGVIAANQAARIFTKEMTRFVIEGISKTVKSHG